MRFKALPPLVIVALLAGAGPVYSQTRTFDIATFTAPDGWSADERGGLFILQHTDRTANVYCQLLVYPSQSAKGNLAEEFAREWQRTGLNRMTGATAPQPAANHAVAGFDAVQGGARFDQRGRKSWAQLFVIAVPPRVVSVVMLAADTQKTVATYVPVVRAFLASLRFTANSAPPAWNNQAPPSAERRMLPVPQASAVTGTARPAALPAAANTAERALLSQPGSIVYLDANRDIWIASPDGALKRRITTDGATQQYRSPSQTDAGVIVAPAAMSFFHYFHQDGTKASEPWTALDIHCPKTNFPMSNQVHPNGTMNVYDYLYSPDCLHAPGFKVGFAVTTSFTARGAYPQFWGKNPRWVPGTSYAAYVSPQGSQIITADNPKEEGTVWITEENTFLLSFDISRTGNKVLIAKAASKSEVGDRFPLIFWQNDGTPPAKGSVVCAVFKWGAGDASPRWSPDGSQFTWADSQGVWVSPAPVPGPGRECVIHPRLIVPGGRSPDWGVANVGSGHR